METTHIYIATDVEYLAPYKGHGAFAVTMVNGEYTKTIKTALRNATDYSAIEMAVVCALGSLRKGGQKIVIHTKNKAYVDGFNNGMKSENSTNYDYYQMIKIISEKQESITAEWVNRNDDAWFVKTKAEAVALKRSAYPYLSFKQPIYIQKPFA